MTVIVSLDDVRHSYWNHPCSPAEAVSVSFPWIHPEGPRSPMPVVVIVRPPQGLRACGPVSVLDPISFIGSAVPVVYSNDRVKRVPAGRSPRYQFLSVLGKPANGADPGGDDERRACFWSI